MEIIVLEAKRVEQVVLQAKTRWKILPGWQDVCPVGFVQSSGLFVLNFDQVDESYKFELKIKPRPGPNVIKLYGRNLRIFVIS
jgi:hypothetical protein